MAMGMVLNVLKNEGYIGGVYLAKLAHTGTTGTLSHELVSLECKPNRSEIVLNVISGRFSQ